MPIPSPEGRQDRKSFMKNCMSDQIMNEEYPESSQRAAICNNKWSKASIEIDLFDEDQQWSKCPDCKCLPCICGS